MTFEYQKQKRDKSSIIPIEEIYTDLDINENDPYVPNVGYRFDSPRRWSNDGSKNKSIGIRDLHLTPSSGDIHCRFLCYGKAGIKGVYYMWDDDSNKYTKLTISGEDSEIEGTAANFYSLSDIYNIQITPQNNFEEVVSNMIEFVNDASWKEIRNVSNSYKVYSPAYSSSSRSKLYQNIYTEDDSLAYITNKYYLKLPFTFMYYYDSDTSNFECKNTNIIRKVLMDGYTRSYGNETINDATFSEISTTSTNVFLNEDIFDATTKYKEQDVIYIFNGKLSIESSELLMIINRDDVKSIEAVYDLFNQKMPKIETLPVVNIDNIFYVIPFIDIDFQSHFKIGEIDSSNTFTNVQTAKIINGFTTNLKLNNVWDRINLIYHASFAETRHRIIGRNNDHWDTPNKMFMVPSGDQDQFYIRFTTDGVHNILPVGAHFNVDLTFFLNPTNNTSTGVRGNHDSFRD